MAHETTRGSAWLFQSLTGGSALIALLNAGRPVALASGILVNQWAAHPAGTPPLLYYYHAGGKGRVTNGDGTPIYDDQLWDIVLVSVPDDAIVEAILDQVDAILGNKAHQAILDGEVESCDKEQAFPGKIEALTTGTELLYTPVRYHLEVKV